MARLPNPKIDDTSIPYRVVIDFLEGTLRKQDAVAFARGFIEHHFDSKTNSGYYVMPYEGGYIFEAHEGGHQHAYLPAALDALEEDPNASVCIQMARRVLEVKRSATGVYTAILLPEGTEPQNPDKIFPQPGPSLVPYQRSGMSILLIGLSIFGVGFLTLLLATIVYLVEVSGLLRPPLATIDFKSLPLTQWQTLQSVAGEKSQSYIRGLHYENGKWQSDIGPRHDMIMPPDPVVVPGQPVATTPPGATPAPAVEGPSTNPLAPPFLPAPDVAIPQHTGAAPMPGAINRPVTPGGPAAPAGLLPPPGTTH